MLSTQKAKQTDLGIILNPAAGHGKAGDIKKQLISYLQGKRIPFHLELTNSSGHAQAIAFRMRNTFKTIVAAGGDGTINEVVSGIVGSKAAIAILPIGSGNDFSKVIRMPKNINHAIDVTVNGTKKLFDLGKVTYWNHLKEKKERYFVNTLGVGLDAEIAKETKQIKFLRGLPLYLLAAIKAVKNYSSNEYRIQEGKKIEIKKAFFICIGNGCYEGGGFKLLPDATPNDSFFDICILEELPLYNALIIVPKLIMGNHKDHKKVSMWKTKNIVIEGKKPFVLHGDGEIFEEKTIRSEIKIMPKKAYFAVPTND